MSKRDEGSMENSEHNSLMNYNSQAYGHDFVQENVKRYIKQFERGKEKSERETKRKERIRNVTDISNNFYTLVTDFYEYGYGRSFHFAPVLSASSSLQECVVAYEREIARTIKANQGMKLLVGKLSLSLLLSFCHCTCISSSPGNVKWGYILSRHFETSVKIYCNLN